METIWHILGFLIIMEAARWVVKALKLDKPNFEGEEE